jgi:hypothetical protein
MNFWFNRKIKFPHLTLIRFHVRIFISYPSFNNSPHEICLEINLFYTFLQFFYLLLISVTNSLKEQVHKTKWQKINKILGSLKCLTRIMIMRQFRRKQLDQCFSNWVSRHICVSPKLSSVSQCFISNSFLTYRVVFLNQGSVDILQGFRELLTVL